MLSIYLLYKPDREEYETLQLKEKQTFFNPDKKQLIKQWYDEMDYQSENFRGESSAGSESEEIEDLGNELLKMEFP